MKALVVKRFGRPPEMIVEGHVSHPGRQLVRWCFASSYQHFEKRISLQLYRGSA
jgi:hypothetical protein